MNKVLSAIIACSSLLLGWNAYAIDYIVEGQVKGLDGKMLYLTDYDKEQTFDSTLVSDGRFKFQGSYERPAYVRVEHGNFYSNIVLDSVVVVDFDSHNPSSGASLTMKFKEILTKIQEIDDDLDKFAEELKSHGFVQPEFGEIYKHLYDKYFPKKLQLYYEALENNPNGIGEFAIMHLGNLWGLTPEEWDVAYSKMSPYLKERRLAGYLNNMYSNLRNSQPGKQFIDFSAKTVNGDDVKLSDFVGKGKYVLVDFWSSWCGPCKEEAEKTLRPLYEKYKDDDRFMILGVAVWDKLDNTIAALERRNYPWPQLVDAGEIPMKLYGFNGIPMIFLMGPDGTILARELRGDNLINTVDSELKQK